MHSIPSPSSPLPSPLKEAPIFDPNALIFMTEKSGSMKKKVLRLLGSRVVFTPKMVEVARKMFEEGEFELTKTQLKYHVAPEFHDPHMIPLLGFQGWEHNPTYIMEHPRKVDLMIVKPKKALNLSTKSKIYRKCKNSWYKQLAKKKERVTKLREQLSRIKFEWKMAAKLSIPPTTSRKRGMVATKSHNYVVLKKWQVKQIHLGKVTRRIPPQTPSPAPRRPPTPPQRPSSPPNETKAQRVRRVLREIGEELNGTIPMYQRRLMAEMDRETREKIREEERRKDPKYMEMLQEKRVDKAEIDARERARLKAEWLTGKDIIVALVQDPSIEPEPPVSPPAPPAPPAPEPTETPEAIMKQCSTCLDDLLGLTVCQELIPKLASIQERYNLYDDEWKPTICFKESEQEEELVEQLICEVEKNSEIPLFAVMSTSRMEKGEMHKTWWSIPLIPFLEMKLRNIRSPRAGVFRAFTPSPHGSLEEFKLALIKNMHKTTGKRTLPSDRFECHTASHLKHMFFLEFSRHKEKLLEEAKVYVDQPRVFTSDVLQRSSYNPYQNNYKMWKQAVEQHCQLKGGKYQWREKAVDWDSMPAFEYKTDRERWEKRFEKVMGKKQKNKMSIPRAPRPGPIYRRAEPEPFFGGPKLLEELTFHEFIAMYKTRIFRAKQINSDPYLTYQERQEALFHVTEDLDMDYFRALQERLEERIDSDKKANSNYGRIGELEAKTNYKRRKALEELEARKLELPSKAAYEQELERTQNNFDAPGASCSYSEPYQMLHDYSFDPYRYATVRKINEFGEKYPISSAPGLFEQRSQTEQRLRQVAQQLEAVFEEQEEGEFPLFDLEESRNKFERREREIALYARIDRERKAKKSNLEIKEEKDIAWLEKEQFKWEAEDLEQILASFKAREEVLEQRRKEWRAQRRVVKNQREAERVAKEAEKERLRLWQEQLRRMEMCSSSSEDLDPNDYQTRTQEVFAIEPERPITPPSNEGEVNQDLEENSPFDADGGEEPMEQNEPEMMQIGFSGYFTPESPERIKPLKLTDIEMEEEDAPEPAFGEDVLLAHNVLLEDVEDAPEAALGDGKLLEHNELLEDAEDAPGALDPEEEAPEDDEQHEGLQKRAPEAALEDDELLNYNGLLEGASEDAPEAVLEDDELLADIGLLEDQDPGDIVDNDAPEAALQDAPEDDQQDAIADAPDVPAPYHHEDFDDVGDPEDAPEDAPEDDEPLPHQENAPSPRSGATPSPTDTCVSAVRTSTPEEHDHPENNGEEGDVQYNEAELLGEPQLANPEPLEVFGEILQMEGDDAVYVLVPDNFEAIQDALGVRELKVYAPEGFRAPKELAKAPEAPLEEEGNAAEAEEANVPEDNALDAQCAPESVGEAPRDDAPPAETADAPEAEAPEPEQVKEVPKRGKKRKLLFEIPEHYPIKRFAEPTPSPSRDWTPLNIVIETPPKKEPVKEKKKKHPGGRPKGAKSGAKLTAEPMRRQPRRSVKKVDSQDGVARAPEEEEINAVMVPMVRPDIVGFLNEPEPVQDLTVDLDVHIPTVARTVSISTNEELLLAEQELVESDEPGPSRVFNEADLLAEPAPEREAEPEPEPEPEPVPEQEQEQAQAQEQEQDQEAEVLNIDEAEQEIDALEPELVAAPEPKKRGRRPKKAPACRNPKKKSRTVDTDTISMISSLSARSKKKYLSSNNPQPRVRGMPTMPIASRLTGVAPKEVAPEPEQEEDDVEEILKKRTVVKPPPSIVEVDQIPEEDLPEPVIKEELEEHWAAPPPHTSTSRKSRKRQRAEREEIIQQEVKQELFGEPPATPDPDIEVTMYTMKRIKQELDEELEECMIVAANYQVPHVSVAVEQPPTDAKPMVVGEEHAAILTAKVWKALNEFFRSDPGRFSEIMIVLDGDTEKRGRVFKKDASVTNRTSEFSVDFINFVAKSPKNIKSELRNLTSYSKFSSALRERASLILSDHHVTPVILFQIVERIPEIKKILRDQCSLSLIGENEREAMNVTENILLARYIESVMKLTALSQVTWASENHVKRRIELIYNGWNMFLAGGGYFRVLLAMNRPDVKPISAGFRKYCEEYLVDIESNYKKGVELLKMTPEQFLEHLCEITGLTMEQIDELEEDAQTEPSVTNSHKCSRCYLNDKPIYFSTYSHLEQHDKLHEAGTKECGLCFEEFAAPEYVMHRITQHCSMKLQDDEVDNDDEDF